MCVLGISLVRRCPLLSRLVTNFCFADDIVVNTEEEEEAGVLVDRLDTTITRYKMEIGSDKTKVMTNNPNGFRHKAIYFSWFGPELFCLLLGPPGFNCWFSFAPVFQWCCSASRGSPGVGRNTFLSSPHLCFIIVFICDLFVSRDDPLMS